MGNAFLLAAEILSIFDPVSPPALPVEGLKKFAVCRFS